MRLTAFICLFMCMATIAQAQYVVYINAGSRASYGNYQELLISSNGNTGYWLRQMNGPTKDSSSFTISRTQLDSFFRKADSLGFFSLNTKYDGGAKDGAGIYISLDYAGRKHAVSLLNTDQPAINALVTWLNSILVTRNVSINYGQHTRIGRGG